MAKQLKKSISLLVAGMMLLSLLPTAAFAAEGEPGEAFAYRACEHTTSYVLQDDSYEATDTAGGYRHYACSECGAEYSYETDPMVYEVNPKTSTPTCPTGSSCPITSCMSSGPGRTMSGASMPWVPTIPASPAGAATTSPAGRLPCTT